MSLLAMAILAQREDVPMNEKKRKPQWGCLVVGLILATGAIAALSLMVNTFLKQKNEEERIAGLPEISGQLYTAQPLRTPFSNEEAAWLELAVKQPHRRGKESKVSFFFAAPGLELEVDGKRYKVPQTQPRIVSKAILGESITYRNDGQLPEQPVPDLLWGQNPRLDCQLARLSGATDTLGPDCRLTIRELIIEEKYFSPGSTVTLKGKIENGKLVILK